MALQTTTLRPGWRMKMVVIIVVLTAFGFWGLYDATVAYPKRGERVARLMEYRYLVKAAGGETNPRSIPARTVSIEDPSATLEQLRRRERDGTLGDGLDANRLQWLRALSVIGRLDPAETTYVDDGGSRDPDTRLQELAQEWANATGQPKLLHAYDIFFQWVIFFVCIAFALWCVILLVRTARVRYSYDPETKTLVLPNGAKIAPGDLKEVDKRRWHKFYVTLVIRDDHPTLGGRRIDLDLYRRSPIEDWVLEMEKEAFGEEEQQTQEEPSSAEGTKDGE